MFKENSFLSNTFICISLLVIIVQCDLSSNQNDQTSNTGTFAVSITDAPIDFPNISQVNVTMSDIQIRNADTGGILTLQDDPFTMNIMSFRNGRRQIVGGDNGVEVGLYDQLSLKITDISIELADGETIDVGVPQQVQDGYTINFTPNIEVLGNGVADVLLDFDLYQSFTQQSEGDNFFPNFTFNPVIRYALLGNTGDLSGNVRGEDNIVITNSLVKLLRGSELLATTFTEPNGDFAIIGLEAGSYELVASKEGLKKDTISVSVEERQITETSLTLDSLNTDN